MKSMALGPFCAGLYQVTADSTPSCITIYYQPRQLGERRRLQKQFANDMSPANNPPADLGHKYCGVLPAENGCQPIFDRSLIDGITELAGQLCDGRGISQIGAANSHVIHGRHQNGSPARY